MKWFDGATQAYIPTNRTDSAIRNVQGYMLFVRGDRTATHLNGPGVISPTILRTSGPINTGTQPAVTVPASGFASIGNPYPSAVDYRALTRAGVSNFFYVWDPKLGGAYNLGAIETFSLSGGNYVNITISSQARPSLSMPQLLHQALYSSQKAPSLRET